MAPEKPKPSQIIFMVKRSDRETTSKEITAVTALANSGEHEDWRNKKHLIAKQRVDFMYNEIEDVLNNGLHEAYIDFKEYLPDFWAHLSGIKAERDLQMKLFSEDPRFESVVDAIKKRFCVKIAK